MKIMQINNVFPLGSTGKIVNDIHKYLLQNNYESIVCYGNGKKPKQKKIYKTSNLFLQKLNAIISRIDGVMYGGCLFSTKKIVYLIKKEKPDIVHIHCINGHTVNIYQLVNWLKKNDIKTVLTLHAEFMYTANCGHSFECEKWKDGCGKCPNYKKETKSWFIDNTHLSWKKMKKAYSNFKQIKIVSVSSWLMNRARQSPFLKNFDHCIILNGIDVGIFRKYQTNELRKSLGLEEKKIIFHATPFFSDDISHIKGGYYVIELAKRLKSKNIQILVAGTYDKSINIPDNVTMLGNISDQKLLAKYYSMADLYLLTSKRETFSMTTAEALCCGTPVVGFKAGAPEQITLKEHSWFVEYGNIQELYNVIIEHLNHKLYVNISDAAINKYSKEKMCKEYIELYNDFYKVGEKK